MYNDANQQSQFGQKKGRRWLKIIVTVLVLFSAVASAYSFISSVLHDPVPGVVNQYYTGIKNQDYVKRIS